MLSLILFYISIAYAQTGTEPVEIPNTSMEWCLSNAAIKDQHVGLVNCTWSQQNQSHPLPAIPGKVYHCKSYPNGKTPSGYEGKLTCPAPTTIGGSDTVYECAVCYTSNNTTGTVDSDCKTSMYEYEKGFCLNKAAELDFKHEIGGLAPKPDGSSPPVPPTFPYVD